MPNNYTTPHNHQIQEDEIDLRELFRTIGRYKWSIMLITLLVTVITAAIAYRMPKYYKTTTIIEVKPKPGDRGGFSLGGAGALLGLPTGGGVGSIDKDAALMGMYRTNQPVLDTSALLRAVPKGGEVSRAALISASKSKLGMYKTNNSNLSIQDVSYAAQYYSYEKYRYLELAEKNCSIAIRDIHISDYRKFGMELIFESLSPQKFSLSLPSTFGDALLGEFSYGEKVHTEYFDITISKKKSGITPSKIILNADTHYIFDTIISRNLSTSVDKNNPFITISYLDTLPQRGEAYVQKLIDNYIGLSIKFELEDANTTLMSLNTQIAELESRVHSSAAEVEQFKSDKQILSPSTQAQVLIRGKASTDDKLIQNRYQKDLVNQLITFVNKNKNIDAIAPSLSELGDDPTTALITKLQSLQLEATSLAQEFKPAYPKLKSIRSQIQSIKSKIKSNLKNLRRTLTSKERSLKNLRREYTRKLKVAPTAEKEMKNILRNATLDEKLYSYLLQKRSAAELKKAEAISRFRTIEPIYTSPRAAKPKKSLIVIVGFITALILSIFLAFFREFLKKGR